MTSKEEYKKALELIEECKKTQNPELDLSFLRLSELPTEIRKLKHIKFLRLWCNPIEDYSFLADLKQLQGLDLFENNVQDVYFLENLIRLKELDLSDNLIQDYSFLT